MRISNFYGENRYCTFEANNLTTSKNIVNNQSFRQNIGVAPAVNSVNSADSVEISSNNKSKGKPLNDYEKLLFKRFQNFSIENVVDLNTGIDVTAESINEDGITPRNRAFLQIAKTPFFIIIERISENEEEEQKLKEKLHSSISPNFKTPSNPIEEAFSQYVEVVPHITQENSLKFVSLMFDDLKQLDSENVTDRDILDVIKTHVAEQKRRQKAHTMSIFNRIFNFIVDD